MRIEAKECFMLSINHLRFQPKKIIMGAAAVAVGFTFTAAAIHGASGSGDENGYVRSSTDSLLTGSRASLTADNSAGGSASSGNDSSSGSSVSEKSSASGSAANSSATKSTQNSSSSDASAGANVQSGTSASSSPQKSSTKKPTTEQDTCLLGSVIGSVICLKL
jgi:hypothetical protein